MMKVVGEEGTHIDDFIIYLKSEFLDYVFLQQNTFDEVDAASTEERQQIMFDKVSEVLHTQFDFEDKDLARKYFLELRQLFIDRNYSSLDSQDYKQLSSEIDSKIAGGRKNA
jgi:V/A-type H+-transporting ATPase subunit A